MEPPEEDVTNDNSRSCRCGEKVGQSDELLSALPVLAVDNVITDHPTIRFPYLPAVTDLVFLAVPQEEQGKLKRR